MDTNTKEEGKVKKAAKKAQEKIHTAQEATMGFFDRNPWTGRILKLAGMGALVAGGYILGKRSGMSPAEVITKSAEVAAQL